MKKIYIKNFELKKESSNTTCDFWRGSGFVKNKYYIVKSGFFFATKKEIIKTLKNKIKEQAL